MFSLILSELAHEDLDSIVAYMTNDLASPQAAGIFLENLALIYGHLQENPFIYPVCNDPRLCREGYRKANIKNTCCYLKLMSVKK